MIGGVIQVLITLLHIGIFFGVASSTQLAADTKVSIHIFNAAVLTTVIFFAYVSFFRKQEMINTVFGRYVVGFIALFYLQRGLVEVFLRGIDPVNLVLSLVTTALYMIIAFPPKRVPATQ